ncbi:Transposable element Tc3 transposase [Anthophora quadrimaculata]
MDRAKQLSCTEIGKVQVLKEEGYSNREIARRLNRSEYVIRSYLKNKENYGKLYKGRTKESLSPRGKRSIVRIASNSTYSGKQIAEKVNVSASVRTVQRYLKKVTTIERKCLKKKPCLKDRHKKTRLEFARKHMDWVTQWQKVVFSDEKKFNLDGPDGYSYYYHDLRKEERIFSRRQHGGGSVMIWGAISSKGVVDLKVLKGRQNSKTYLEILKMAKIRIFDVVRDNQWIFQQDNAAIHTAKLVKNWFEEQGITCLEWPALSPDVNIIENVWGYLSRNVYINNTQFSSREELINAIKKEWNNIPLSYIETLYKSLPNRIFQIINNNGGCTKY